MLIPYSELVQKFKIKPTGILHIGASTGQEVKEYYDNGVERTIWVEADPEVFEQLKENIKGYNNATAINALVSYVDGFEVPFYITGNNGESSSMLQMGTHKDVHPDVKVVKTIELQTARVDRLLINNNLEMKDYDFINLDIQGAELLALKGMGKLLNQVNYAYIEVNKEQLYLGCPLIEQIDEYLQKYGLFRVNEASGGTKWSGDTGWGDAFYMRSPESLDWIMLDTKQIEGRLTRSGQTAPVQVVDLKEAKQEYTPPKPQPGQLGLSYLIDKFDMKVRGIINIGAFYGDQVAEYDKLGIKKRALIEPNPIAYAQLELKHQIGSYCFNTAVSEFEGSQNINISVGDHGSAGSFLNPKIQLKQYPNVKFTAGQHSVRVTRLDSMGLDVGLYNMISIDTNGSELLALKGATVTLSFMHYVLAKVYFAELYENNPTIEQMDAFMTVHGFMRVETDKAGVTWGTALYAKKQFVKLPQPKKLSTKYTDADVKNEYLELEGVDNPFVEKVPIFFRPHQTDTKPVDNHFPFEEWFYKNFGFEDQRSERVYLPVFWNSYYDTTGANKKPAYVDELQGFIDKLDKEKKYYTITTYEQGILNNLDGLDIKVYAAQGNRVDYNIPLVCTEHEYKFETKKDIFISFVGTITDPIREKMIEWLPKDNPDFYISTKPHTLEEYCKILARSKYVLCPRGRGNTSFRVAEALQYGATPIYIQDDQKLKFGIDSDDKIESIFELVNEFEEGYGYSGISKEGKVYSLAEDQARYWYDNHFTFQKVKEAILNDLE